MNVAELIVTKRDGGVLSGAAIRQLIDGYVAGDVPDYQVSAFLMAAFLRGLNESETAALVDSMLHSGRILDHSAIPGAKIDKHSTGGVGDKVSLILAPLAAACGITVPMISGRGLGHTGGTLDKLESIPGMRTDLGIPRFEELLATNGVAMIGQTDDIAPADRGLYALRDVTGTVESIPLIAASIMSKKLAAGLDGLVLDVKTGSGAFMQSEERARKLAETLVAVGEGHGCPTVALLTAMDEPLGRTAGNWPEVVESIDCLRGGGPTDLREVTVALVAEMLLLGKVDTDLAAAGQRARRALDDGSAYERFERMVESQGGDPAVIADPASRSALAIEVRVTARPMDDQYVTSVDARSIGDICVSIGAGRRKKEDAVDPLAGITLNKKTGDPVGSGDTLALLHGSDEERLLAVIEQVHAAFRYGPELPRKGSLIRGRFQSGQWTAPTD